jgi:hypothetical protein
LLFFWKVKFFFSFKCSHFLHTVLNSRFFSYSFISNMIKCRAPFYCIQELHFIIFTLTPHYSAFAGTSFHYFHLNSLLFSIRHHITTKEMPQYCQNLIVLFSWIVFPLLHISYCHCLISVLFVYPFLKYLINWCKVAKDIFN